MISIDVVFGHEIKIIQRQRDRYYIFIALCIFAGQKSEF